MRSKSCTVSCDMSKLSQMGADQSPVELRKKTSIIMESWPRAPGLKFRLGRQPHPALIAQPPGWTTDTVRRCALLRSVYPECVSYCALEVVNVTLNMASLMSREHL